MSNVPRLVEPPVAIQSPTGGQYIALKMDQGMTIGQFMELMRSAGGEMGMMMRVCDGCQGPAGQNPVECQCVQTNIHGNKCGLHYDLCVNCTSFARDRCPDGYGCANIN